MKINCPVCNKEVGPAGALTDSCNNIDHEFWFNKSNNWFIWDKKSDLFINNYFLNFNNTHNKESLLEINYDITPEEGWLILKKYIKLMAFV